MSKTKADKLIDTMDMDEARRKRKVAVDENLIGLGGLLRKKGYNVLDVPTGKTDEDVHDFLLEKNVKIFITRNGQHFVDFFREWKARYSMLWIQLNWDVESLANAVNRVIISDLQLTEPLRISKRKKGGPVKFQYVEMNQRYIDRILGKLGK